MENSDNEIAFLKDVQEYPESGNSAQCGGGSICNRNNNIPTVTT